MVFDRIRELWGDEPQGAGSREVVEPAILQTVPRTVNTGLGALFILAALAVLGGDSLHGLRDRAADRHRASARTPACSPRRPVAIVLERYAKSPPPKPKDRPKAPVHRTSDSSGAVV